MRILDVKKGDIVAAQSEKVMEWYIIQKGVVSQQFEFAEILLETNSIIGILENGWFICNYVAKEDTRLIAIDCKDANDLQRILSEHENFRALFLRSAILQSYKAFELYTRLSGLCFDLHEGVEQYYAEYKAIAAEQMLPVLNFSRISNFEPIQMKHMALDWEIQYINALIKKHFTEYMQLMMKDDGLCVGSIMEFGAQMRRVTQGIEEMVNYLSFHRDLLYSDTGNDLFSFMRGTAMTLSAEGRDVARVESNLRGILSLMQKLGVFTEKQCSICSSLIGRYADGNETQRAERVDVENVNCVEHIMEYAGFSVSEAVEYKRWLDQYRLLPDKDASIPEAYALRKKITEFFYSVYEKAFLRSMSEEQEFDTILAMFFYFGFMDNEFFGEENIGQLAGFAERINFFRSAKIVTVYDWLAKIYRGEEEPSKSELDVDYQGYLSDLRKSGKISVEQLNTMRESQVEKVRFEIRNMFRVGHRVAYGRITTFVPVLSGDELYTSMERVAVTAERIKDALNRIRAVDYQLFYHDVVYSEPDKGMQNEMIKMEILPNIILMPTIGSRGMMWQESAGVRSNTPGRFVLPIWSSSDLFDVLLEVAGRYRWEYCKHVMGIRWNDIREKSLTSAYTDYLQFYRKNHDLSAEAREKIKLLLSRAKNSYREVFVRDYLNWIKFESKGGLRLNSVSRGIMAAYCPFSGEIRESLSFNPIYEALFRPLNLQNEKMQQRLRALYDKYERAGGTIGAELSENLKFYQM